MALTADDLLSTLAAPRVMWGLVMHTRCRFGIAGRNTQNCLPSAETQLIIHTIVDHSRSTTLKSFGCTSIQRKLTYTNIQSIAMLLSTLKEISTETAKSADIYQMGDLSSCRCTSQQFSSLGVTIECSTLLNCLSLTVQSVLLNIRLTAL